MRADITLSDLNLEIRGDGNSYRKNIVSKISIGVIEFLLASIFYSYAVIFCEHAVLDYRKKEDGIFTTIVFICSGSLTEPISRFIVENFDDRNRVLFRCLVGCGVIVLFISITIPNAITLYMCIAGILSSIITTQLHAFAMDKLDMDSRIYEVIRQVSRALSLVISPHLIFILKENYTLYEVTFIYGSILINIVPAGLLVKTWESQRPIKEISRYQTIGRHTYQLDNLKTFPKREPRSTSESVSSDEDESLFEQPNHFEQKQHTEDSENNAHELGNIIQNSDTNSGVENANFTLSSDHQIYDMPTPSLYLNPVNVQNYYQIAGVSILPGIPEENEEESDDINYINPKRLSMISDKLEELNNQEQKEKKDFANEVFTINEVINEHKPEPIDKIEYIRNFDEKKNKNRISVIDELKYEFKKPRNYFHCSPYRKYVWTRRLRTSKDFLVDNMARPLYYAIKNIYFYPCLTTKTTNNLVSTLYIIFAPLTLVDDFNLSKESAYILTYIGFAWCFFLVGLPVVIKFNPTKMRIMFSAGLVASGISILLLCVKLSNHTIILSSLLFGFGYGLVSFSEKIVYKSSIGMRPWYFIQGPLEVLSAILIFIIYFFVHLQQIELQTLLFVAALAYFVNAFLWITLPFMKYFIHLLSRLVFDERSQQADFFH